MTPKVLSAALQTIGGQRLKTSSASSSQQLEHPAFTLIQRGLGKALFSHYIVVRQLFERLANHDLVIGHDGLVGRLQALVRMGSLVGKKASVVAATGQGAGVFVGWAHSVFQGLQHRQRNAKAQRPTRVSRDDSGNRAGTGSEGYELESCSDRGPVLGVPLQNANGVTDAKNSVGAGISHEGSVYSDEQDAVGTLVAPGRVFLVRQILFSWALRIGYVCFVGTRTLADSMGPTNTLHRHAQGGAA